MDLATRALAVHERLLAFYGEPVWRNPLPPLGELVSTILSQNTNDTNRDVGYSRLRERFPTWEAVRDADPDQVIKAIRPAWPTRKGPASRERCARSARNAAAWSWISWATCPPRKRAPG